MNIVLNNEFLNKSKEYQTRPVKAARYQEGMENGFLLWITGQEHSMYQAIIIFNTKKDLYDFVDADHEFYIHEDRERIQIEIEYSVAEPILCRKWIEGEERTDIFGFGDDAIEGDESKDYEVLFIYENTWIIQNEDGSVRTWHPEDEAGFFGDDGTYYICEKDNEHAKIEL